MNAPETPPLPHRRSGEGPPLVLVHGYLGGSKQWQTEIAHLSARFDVIAPDLPGFGDAAHLTGSSRIGDMADRIIALLDDLGIGRFTLLGHSMGGMVVQDMATKLGPRVEKLVLYGTGPLGLMPDRFETIEQSRSRLVEDGVARTIERIGATWFFEGASAPGFPLVTEIGAMGAPDAALRALTAMATWDGRARLGDIIAPTLIIWGHEDQSYRWPQVETLWHELPNAALSVLPGTSHAAHLEKPHLFLPTLDDFLAG